MTMLSFAEKIKISFITMKKILKIYLQPAFLLSVAVLGTASAHIMWTKSHEDITTIKKAIPLKKSFDLMDENAFSPYKVVAKQSITNKDIIESLGTEDYVQWTFEDSSVPLDSPVRNCSLFVTYYTGNPDQVPHVPDACYIGGGHERINKFSVSFNVKNNTAAQTGVEGSKKRRISATGLILARKSKEIWQIDSEFAVLYFFRVNNVYKGNRTETRIALGTNLRSEYSYFSKIELKFFNMKTGYPTKEQSIAAAEDFLSVVLPVLENDHWPDWD